MMLVADTIEAFAKKLPASRVAYTYSYTVKGLDPLRHAMQTAGIPARELGATLHLRYSIARDLAHVLHHARRLAEAEADAPTK